MKIRCYFEHGAMTYCNIAAHNFLYDKLKEKYKDIEFNYTHSLYVRDEHNGFNVADDIRNTYSGPACKYGPYYMVIQNEENKKYILVSYWDKLIDFFHTNWDVENCVEILTGIGLHKEDVYFQRLNLPHTPTSFVGTYLQNETLIDNLYQKRLEMKEENKHIRNLPYSSSGRVYPDILSFRGNRYLFRQYLSGDKRFLIHNETVGAEEYIHELDSFALNFSPNGAGEICFRDMEILGLGSVLFRQTLTYDFHNKLIPDYHYIAVDFRDLAEPFKMSNEDYWKLLADRMIDKFNKVKNDYDFIDFVAENGRKWYEKNGTAQANADIALSLINLDKLR